MVSVPIAACVQPCTKHWRWATPRAQVLVYVHDRWGALWDVFAALDGAVWGALGLTMASVSALYWLFNRWCAHVSHTYTMRPGVQSSTVGCCRFRL